VRFGSALVATALVVACSGQTLEGDPITRGFGGSSTGGMSGAGKGGATAGSPAAGEGGTGGNGGASMTGGSGGASMTGGSGGTPMLGGSAGTMPGAGGAMTGGTAGMPPVMGGSGGASTTGGTAGAAGEGVCELPLVTGPCQALFYMYGFDAALGHCVLFPYGGCDGNENRFETLGECEGACGGSTLAGCPDMLPSATECEPLDDPCYYNVSGGCLCVPEVNGIGCDKIDPNCPQTLLDACNEEGCTRPIIGTPRNRCECTNGTWACYAG